MLIERPLMSQHLPVPPKFSILCALYAVLLSATRQATSAAYLFADLKNYSRDEFRRRAAPSPGAHKGWTSLVRRHQQRVQNKRVFYMGHRQHA